MPTPPDERRAPQGCDPVGECRPQRRTEAARERRPSARQAARDDRQDRPRRDDKPTVTAADDEDNDGTVGFGDDMPAFMRIAGKV